MAENKPQQGQPEQFQFVPMDLDWWPLPKFASIVGWSRRKVESKIQRQWTENVHFRYDPDGEIHINIREYCKWVESGPGSKRARNPSKYGSLGKASGFGKPSRGRPRQLT